MNDFEFSLAFTLKEEGALDEEGKITPSAGYTNDPNDAGGETKFGISKRAYPNIDIKSLTYDKVKEIYKKDYWDKAGCDSIPFPYNVCVFDCAVNQGVGRASQFLIKAKDWNQFITLRAEHYLNLNNKSEELYERGWINRLLRLQKYIYTKQICELKAAIQNRVS